MPSTFRFTLLLIYEEVYVLVNFDKFQSFSKQYIDNLDLS